MSETEIKVSDYQLFDNGVEIINSFKEKETSTSNKINEIANQLNDESIFLGPVCDNCKSATDQLKKSVDTNISNLQTISKLLSDIYTCYKNSDRETLNKLLGITSATDTTTTATSANSQIQSALNWAIGIANDNSHGYSRNTRWGNPNYDCSSLVISAYEQAGIKVKSAGASSTRNMKQVFTKCGFQWIPGDPKKTGLTLQPGDVLLKIGKHTEMYVGDNKNVGAHDNYDNKNGDSKGNEISIKASKHSWDGVLRYVRS